MKEYIGVKLVQAEPMTRGKYNQYRGWTIPKNENPVDEGYLVKYPDGYESWCPKKQFEEANRETSGMTFGLAIEAMKKGFKVARRGWNGKGMWIALSQNPLNPLPADHFWCGHAQNFAFENGGSADVLPTLIMKTADNRILMGWLASQTDMLAEDWMVIE
jgi:hypothetical protein